MARTLGTRNVHVGGSALAREVGLSPSTVSQRLSRGQTADDIRRYAAVRRGEVPPDQEDEDDEPNPAQPGSELEHMALSLSVAQQLEDAKLRRARALAERQEIENMVRRGELMPVAYILKVLPEILIDGRDTLLRLPSEVADELAEQSDPLKVRAILTVAVDRIVAKFDEVKKLWEPQKEETEAA